ncbi:MAG: SIS domain-containing protein, partial [Rhodospirillales bacterium]|nr:SIS domain-containing protein [Rhodospirillales bacterium]
MSDSSTVNDAFREAATLFAAVAEDPAIHAALEQAARVTVESLRGGGQLLLCGNGGSAAEATHFAGELVGAFYNRHRDPLRAIPLGFDPASLTSLANDFGYERALAKQLQALAKPGDVLWALSTSGNSPNILTAMKQAREIGVTNILFT